MKLNLYWEDGRFLCADDETYENRRRLKTGHIYEATIREVRNPKFHRLYFSLISTAWSYLNEKQEAFFHHSIDSFRKTLELAAGHCDTIYSIERREFIDIPKSIAFDKMDELAFRELYDKIKDVLFNTFLKDISEEEFQSNLSYF